MNNLLMAVLTGSTCGAACWEAREHICRCSCGGANHGILLSPDGKRPQRTAKIGGQFYELVAVIPRGENPYNVEREICAERFPGLDWYAYGEYGRAREKYRPVLVRKISASQSKWPEVQAVEGARSLVWARPAGTPYCTRESRGTA